MVIETKNIDVKIIEEFISDYETIVNSSENSVVIKTEWTKEGDNFQKLSMYDNSYSSVKTFDSTTLIKAL